MKKKIEVIISILLIIFLICYIYFIQEKIFFHPWHDNDSYNRLLTEDNVKEINIDNNGKKLHGWVKINNTNEVAPLLIMFLGNAENSSNTLTYFIDTNKFNYFNYYNVMMIDYPGYGLSEGTTSDKNMFESAEKIYDYACNLDYIDKDNIVIMGYSIGTGVATYLSSVRDVNGLILLAPYDEALSLYNYNVNIFYGPMKLLMRYKFESKKYAKDVKVNPLIITSYDDEVINYKFTHNLAKYFNNVDNLITLENVSHSGYYSNQIVLDNISNYLNKINNLENNMLFFFY